MATITVNPATSYQTFSGWETTAEACHQFTISTGSSVADYPSDSFGSYKSALLTGLEDLGVTRVRLEFRLDDYNATGYTIDSPYPAAVQPSTATSGQKFYNRITNAMDAWVTDYRNQLAANGKTLELLFCVVDFRDAGYDAENTPSEYSLAVKEAIQHFYTTYGYLPDAIEPCLEPDAGQNTTNWTAAKLANNIVQLHTDLAALDSGGSPGYGNLKFCAPSTTLGANANTWLNDMITANAAVEDLLLEVSYHRYGGFDTGLMATLRTTAEGLQASGVPLSMLEFGGGTVDQLWDDLTVGRVVSWQQYTAAFWEPGLTDDGYQFFMINDSTLALTMAERTKYLRHFMKYILPGSVMKGITNTGGNCQGVAFEHANGTYTVAVQGNSSTSSETVTIEGLPAGTYEIRRTLGNFTAAPSAYDVALTDQTIGTGEDIVFTMPSQGVATVYAANFDAPAATPGRWFKLAFS